MNTMMQGLLSGIPFRLLDGVGIFSAQVSAERSYQQDGLLLHMAFNPSSVPDTLFPDSQELQVIRPSGSDRRPDGSRRRRRGHRTVFLLWKRQEEKVQGKLPGLQGLMCRKWMWKRTREGRRPQNSRCICGGDGGKNVIYPDVRYDLAGVASSCLRIAGASYLPLPPFYEKTERAPDSAGGSRNFTCMHRIMQRMGMEEGGSPVSMSGNIFSDSDRIPPSFSGPSRGIVQGMGNKAD